MPLQSIAILTAVLVIVGAEAMLWFLFRRRVTGFLFSREVDVSAFRFFTLFRLRLCMILHTVFLLTVVILSLLFAW